MTPESPVKKEVVSHLKSDQTQEMVEEFTDKKKKTLTFADERDERPTPTSR